jgi:hypothetical protein
MQSGRSELALSADRQDNPLASPWAWSSGDSQGRQIGVEVAFNISTGVVTGVATSRAAGCAYGRLLIGLGGDGRPDSTTRLFVIQEGSNPIPLGQWSAKVGPNIQDLLAQQITAGP